MSHVHPYRVPHACVAVQDLVFMMTIFLGNDYVRPLQTGSLPERCRTTELQHILDLSWWRTYLGMLDDTRWAHRSLVVYDKSATRAALDAELVGAILLRILRQIRWAVSVSCVPLRL